MSQIIQINSKKGMVTLSKEDMVEYDLMRWLRNASKGVHGFQFISTKPFESVAARLFLEEYPGFRTKVAEAVRFNESTEEVSVVLQVTGDVSSDYYKHHDTKLVFRKEPKSKVETPLDTDAVYKEASKDKKYYDIVFLQNSQDFEGFDGSGGTGVDGFFESSEEEMFEYLIQWYSPESINNSYYDNAPWGEDDLIFEKNLGDQTFIVSYNPSLQYAGLLLVEDYKEEGGESIQIGVEDNIEPL